jgi:hypothetical protein
MSGKRDWDKVSRDRRVYEHGNIPAWWDGWAAEPWAPSAPSIVTEPAQVSEKSTLEQIVETRTTGNSASPKVGERSPDTKPLRLKYMFDPPWKLKLEVLELLLGTKLPFDLNVRAGELRFICLRLPSQVHAWICEPMIEDPSGGRTSDVERRLRLSTKLIEVRVRGLKVTFHLEYSGKPHPSAKLR